MKFFKFFVIIPMLLLTCQMTACTKGQSPEFLGPEGSQKTPSADESAVNEQLAKEAGIIHLIYHVGPVDLPAGTSFEAAQDKPLVMKFQVDQPLWVIGFEPKVISAAGEALPAELLHHAIISNLHEENPICTEGSVGNPFIAATSTLTKIRLPQGFGYAVLPTDPLEAKVILSNPTDQAYVDVSFELNMIAKPMNEFTGMKDVKPLLLDVDPCNHKPLQIEPEQFVKRQATFSLPNTGNIMVAHAILQNYGAFVELIKGSDVMPFWRADAFLDENHRITELINNPFEDPAGVKLKKGEPITLGVAYDNTKTSWLKDATASAMIYFAFDED